MSSARYIVGDVHQVLADLPPASVDLVLTSPPFLALRSYLPPDHPDKALEMGSEPTPGEFIDGLLDVVEACRRVLTPHGSIAFELGDTYAGSGGAGGDYNADGWREGQERFDGSKSRAFGTGAAARPARVARDPINRNRGTGTGNGQQPRSGRPKYQRPVEEGGALRDRDADEADGIIPVRSHTRRQLDGWPLDKSLCLIPELFRVSLVYGFNPLTGRETEQWRARNVVRWCRPNPPVGALADKVRPATSDILIGCTSRSRYFDLDAVRTPLAEIRQNEAGAPPLDHWWHEDEFDQDAWLVATEPYPGSHYATWPRALLVKPIDAMCPRRVCTTCGEPSRRITAVDHQANRSTNGPQSAERRHVDGADRQAATVGWTDCGHDTWRQGVVLDPFAGSGTTLAVAVGCGRDAIGVDLDTRNVELARARVGMFLTVDADPPAPVDVVVKGGVL